MNLISLILSAVVGSVVFLFIFWSKLKDDYIANQIFSVAFISIFLSLILGISSLFIFKQYWFWLMILGFSLGLALGILKFKLKAYETVNGAVGGLILFFTIFISTISILEKDWLSLGHATILLMAFMIYVFIEKNYKLLIWHKSGRIGISGLLSMAVYFLIRTIIAFIFPDMISFVGSFDSVVSGLVFIVLVISALNLSFRM